MDNKPLTAEELDRLRKLAEGVDCYIEPDVELMTGCKASTLEAWRKRGLPPEYVLFGTNYFYPRAPLAKHLASRVRRRAEVPAKELL